ncbi:MAG TPA: glycoside hydrolase family 2 TIM barrel-domain containing protein [Acidimicrobiales bacterium]|nr:glycoside hydrolase family 2 TIM barrel-domain containing protein [Acidimicrobiales bacterium]
MTPALQFDDRATASLDGEWDFFPGDHALGDLDRLAPEPIRVPGLWETQGYLDLDGTAWYRRRFRLHDTSGDWTLRFGAVMDLAEVYLNGRLLGRHDQPFTPFEVDPTSALDLHNDLAVRVDDPSLDDERHLRMAHGKQGWANQVFPSRPSLYMTYGGIWQPVTLRRHGPAVLNSVFVNADPDDLVVAVEVENRGPSVQARLGVRTLGRVRELEVHLRGGEPHRFEVRFGATDAPRWRTDEPNLHHALVDLRAGDALSDSVTVRYGLRTVRMEGRRMLVNDEPYRMKSVLVQGFGADELYAEPSRAAIEQEVTAARAMGFNTLRLHIKAFDPVYLDVCDETGMLLHCDIPVAEPIAHEEMGADTELTRRSVAAARQQVRRDRNHPSIVLWSAMNEVCDGCHEARQWPGYEAFARALAGAVTDEDPTRPVIENDWVEPDPGRVFVSPILTAHWYGRLHRDYLDKIERASARWEAASRPLFVTEFGDWGLPDMPVRPDPPFWDSREAYATSLAQTRWPASVARFVQETQRYQGVSDRLQAEVFRRYDHIGGYCLTELTDVPQELNGVLDLHRRPKPIAVDELTRANQTVLPMLCLHSLVVAAGGLLRAPLHVANDAGPLDDVAVEGRFGESMSSMGIDELLAVDARSLPPDQVVARFRETVAQRRLGPVPPHRASAFGQLELVVPDVPGSHDLVLRLYGHDALLAENRYPIHVVDQRPVSMPVRLVGGGPTADALEAVGATVGHSGLTVVAEGALDAVTGADARQRLERGEVVVVLAQPIEAGPWYPVPVVMSQLATAWGSTDFRFSTDHGAIPSLPRRAVLVAEDSTVQARVVVASFDEEPFPDTPVIIAYKPVPGAMTGTVVGSHAVGPGRLVFCQYRLATGAASDDAAARALLADVLRWASRPRPVMARHDQLKDDGRRLVAYSWSDEVAR